MTSTPVAPPVGGNPYGITLFSVMTPSGSQLNLQTQEEADYYEDRRDRYTYDNHFPNVSDLMDLDRLLVLEVMVMRWGLWLLQGFDYMHARVDEGALKNNIKDYSVETRLLKQALGIDKATRDKEKGESLADYVHSLLQRAKEFGYHRNEQYEIVVTKMYELRSMVMTWDRCDDEERALLDLSQEKIFDWIRDNVIKDFDEHSEAFRKNQSIWVRTM
jgi:hypothetical protein